jgi:hypothetical protein
MFVEISNIKFHEIVYGGSRADTGRRTDGHDGANRRFSLFMRMAE